MTRSPLGARAGLGALVLLLLAACASEPAYAPPTGAEARTAYLRALRADYIDSPPPRPPAAIAPGALPDKHAHQLGNELEYQSALNSRETGRRLLGSFQRIALGECEWIGVDAGDSKAVSRPRLEGVAEGYRCAYEVFQNSPQRGLVSATGSGYFFHRDGGYDFAEIEQTTYRPVKQ